MSTTPKRPRRVSLADVARLAGVSSNTVSRVVRGDPEVADDTRKRIREILVEVGYRPNFAARALAARRTGIIQVILAAPMYHGHGQTLLAVMNEAAEAGYSVVVKNAYGVHGLTEKDAVSFDVDGVIILGGQGSTVDLALRAARTIPTVLLLSNESDLGTVSTVSVDNRMGTYMAARHLIEQGCTRLIHLRGAADWSDAHERHKGYEMACFEANIETELIEAGSWDSDDGYRAMRHFLELDKDAFDGRCGIVAANDQLALGTLRAVHEVGVRVPEELKIVGFDDAEGSSCFSPPLTTISQHFDKVGAEAIGQLKKLLNGETPCGVLIQPELVIRASSTQ